MKKIHISLLSLLAVSVLVSCSNTLLMSFSEHLPVPYGYNEHNKNNVKVPENVLEEFNKKYPNKNTGDVSWLLDKENNYCACFKMNGKTVRATFNRRADLLCSISTYNEELLPRDILFEVKENYFKKNISNVTEVNMYDKTAYLINLEDNTSWMTIKLLDGRITEENFYLKNINRSSYK